MVLIMISIVRQNYPYWARNIRYQVEPTAYSSSDFYFNWLIENKINYNTVINEDHSINAVLVQSAQKETYKGDNVTATDFPNDYIQTISGGTVIKGASDKTPMVDCFLSGSCAI